MKTINVFTLLLLVILTGCAVTETEDVTEWPFGYEESGKKCRMHKEFFDMPRNSQTRLIIFGDSISEQPDGFAKRFSDHYGYQYQNLAVGGSTLPCQLYNAMKADIRAGDIVLLMSGHNDMRYGYSVSYYSDHLRKFRNHVLSQGAALILGTTMRMLPHMYAQKAPYDKGSDYKAGLYRDALYSIVANFPSITVVDTYNLWEPWPSLYHDEVHPNEAGKQDLAFIFINNI